MNGLLSVLRNNKGAGHTQAPGQMPNGAKPAIVRVSTGETVGTSPAAAHVSMPGQAAIVHPAIKLARDEINVAEQLTQVHYDECVNAVIGLSSGVAAQVAVLAQTATKNAVLLLTKSVTSDVIDGVLEQMAKRGFSLTQGGVNAFCATPQIVMSVVGQQISADQNRRNRGLLANTKNSGHWEAFRSVVQWAHDQQANDIDFVLSLNDTTSRIFFKIHNRYVTQDRWQMPTQALVDMLGVTWQHGTGGGAADLQLRIVQQAAVDVALAQGKAVRLRMSNLPTEEGATVTFRIQPLGISRTLFTLEDAGYLPNQIATLERNTGGKGGAITLAGTVGSGKTTSLAILMELLHKKRPYLKGVSFEDPVETKSSWMHQKTIIMSLIGDDNSDFKASTSALFRSAVDVFMLGEVRNLEAGQVLRAVLESGHSMYTTTHARSALGIFSRLSMPQIGVPIETLGTPGMLRLNAYQALLLKNCMHCAVDAGDHRSSLAPTDRAAFDKMMGAITDLYGLHADVFRFRSPQGCEHCKTTGLPELAGYAGRTVCAELIEPDETMCELVLKNDAVGLQRYWRGLSDGNVLSEDMTGKTAMEIAVLKAAQGLIDPHEIQTDFEMFETLAHKSRKRREGVAA